MARTVSLATLRARVREIADLGPDTTSGRYPNARINRELNQSWQRAREIAVTKGDGNLYLKQATGTMTAGALNSNTSFGTIPYPTDCIEIHGIDVIYTATDIVPLLPMGFGDRNLFLRWQGQPTGRPLAFSVLNVGTESGSGITTGTIAVYPAPDSNYSYALWYVPSWTDITNDTDVFNGIAGHDDWAVWDTVIKIAAGDADMETVVQLAETERGKAEELLSRRANAINRAGPVQRRDVAATSRRNSARQRYYR